MAKFERPHSDIQGRVIETPQESRQAENSKDSFTVLRVSLVLAVFAGIGLFWYFGILPGLHHTQAVQSG